MLENPEWLDKKYPFYGGQQVNKVYAEMADAVDKGWEWDPIHEYVATRATTSRASRSTQGKGATAALQPWQDAVDQVRQAAGPHGRRVSQRGARRAGGPLATLTST